MSIVWHYTTRVHLIDILRSRHIRTSPLEPLEGERAAVWFSRAPLWEPTAAKGLLAVDNKTGQPRGLPVLSGFDHLEALMGLARVGVEETAPDRYTSFEEFSQCCHPSFIEHLILRAESMKQDLKWEGPTGPEQWVCSLVPVQVHEFARVDLWNRVTRVWDIEYMRSTQLDTCSAS